MTKIMNKNISVIKINFLLYIYIYNKSKMPNFFKNLSNSASSIYNKVDKGASNFFTKTAPDFGNKIG